MRRLARQNLRIARMGSQAVGDQVPQVPQKRFDPITEPLPIDTDRFQTIITADGKQITLTESVQKLYYAEQYNRLTKDIWGLRFALGTAGVFLYGWNLAGLPLKIEIANNQEITMWANITGTFIGPGSAPALEQWNQAIMILPGTFYKLDQLARINEDTTGQKFIEIFTNQVSAISDPGSEIILYFNESVPAPKQYSPP